MLSYRITPAYAGKTSIHCKSLILLQDHPRVCGKDEVENFRMMIYLGSPPRMRERLYHPLTLISGKGITPAYAGKT